MDATKEPKAKLDIDWKRSAKDLAKALAKGMGAAIVRGFVIISGFLFLNLGFAIVFFFLAGLAGGGHGSLIALPLALVPFAPFVVLAFVFAQKQGVMRIVAGAVESQGPNVAELFNFYFGAFLRARWGTIKETRGGATLDNAWQKYVKGLTDAPWVVRVVLGHLTSKIRLGEICAELAEKNVPAEQVPREVMSRIFSEQVRERLGPSWVPILVLLAANVVWFPVSILLTRWYLAS